MATSAPRTASAAAGDLRARDRSIAVGAILLGAGTGIAAAAVVLGTPLAIAIIAGAATAAMVWMAPWTAVVGMVLFATIVEQFSLVSEGTLSDGTDHIPLFQSLNASGLGGIYASPYELFLGLVIVVWLTRGFATRTLRLPSSSLAASVGALAVLVAIGWVRGVAGGGSFQNALLELRPWLYLTIAFIASSQLIKSRKHVVALVWALAAGIAVKGAQGVTTLVVHFSNRPPQAILAHEESFFFGLFIALLAVLWLVPVKGRLRVFMTAAFPLVLVADIANQRRTAWAIAALALATVFVICFLGIPARRQAIAALAAVAMVLAAAYWVGFSNDPGLLGQPARAVLSQLAPSARDQSSNQYRVVEDVNLGIAIRNSMPFGTGFGHPIPQAVPNVDISNIDTFIAYLPHNTVLYIWLRLGILGIIAFWMMVGIALMTAVTGFRGRPSSLAMILSAALISAVVAYIVQGFFDMGLYWFRIAIIMGCLMGAIEALRRLEADERVEDQAEQSERSARRMRARRDLQSAA